MAASAIWTAEPVPGLSTRGRSLCPTSLPEGVVCAPSPPEGVVCPLSTRGCGLCLASPPGGADYAPSPPEGMVRAWPLRQRVRPVSPLRQRAWSVPDLSSRGRDLSLNSPAGVMSCTRPLCQRCGLYPPLCQRTWPWVSGAAGPPLTVRLAVVLRWGRG